MAGAPPPQLEMGDLENPRPLKRRRRSIVPPPPEYEDAAPVVSEELAAGLLNKSAAMILKSVGYHGATTVAQERLRQLAEDRMFPFILHHCYYIICLTLSLKTTSECCT